jgi:hypothetical protein
MPDARELPFLQAQCFSRHRARSEIMSNFGDCRAYATTKQVRMPHESRVRIVSISVLLSLVVAAHSHHVIPTSRPITYNLHLDLAEVVVQVSSFF